MTVISAPRPVDTAPNPRVVIGNNEPPLDQRIVGEFDEAIDAKHGLRDRIAQLIAKGEAPAACTDDDMAGRYGDFIKMVANAESYVDGERVRIKAPYLEATRALDAKANGIKGQLADAKARVKAALDKFMREQAAIAEAARQARQREIDAENARVAAAAEAERHRLQAIADEEARVERARLQAEEDARAAAEAREAKAVVVEAVQVAAPDPEPVVQHAAEPEAPVFRGDLGSRVGTKTVWKFDIENVRQVPDAILKSPAVVEAIGKVVGVQVRSGVRTIKGVRIWSEQTSSVR